MAVDCLSGCVACSSKAGPMRAAVTVHVCGRAQTGLSNHSRRFQDVFLSPLSSSHHGKPNRRRHGFHLNLGLNPFVVSAMIQCGGGGGGGLLACLIYYYRTCSYMACEVTDILHSYLCTYLNP